MAVAQLNAKESAQFIKEHDPLILDVRTPEEFNNGHIKGALNYDIYQPSFGQRIAQLDRSKTYLIYCRTGARSDAAARMMAQIGFESVINMTGGTVEWGAEGMLLVR